MSMHVQSNRISAYDEPKAKTLYLLKVKKPIQKCLKPAFSPPMAAWTDVVV